MGKNPEPSSVKNIIGKFRLERSRLNRALTSELEPQYPATTDDEYNVPKENTKGRYERQPEMKDRRQLS